MFEIVSAAVQKIIDRLKFNTVVLVVVLYFDWRI